MAAPSLDLDKLWNAAAYRESGRCPWTILAYPASLADDQLLPRDEESLRYLAALLTAGAPVGLWHFPESQAVYFACPFEEKERVQGIVAALEIKGEFPVGFARDHCDRLFSTSN